MLIVILSIYLALTLITFLVFAWDKRAARLNRWRIRERTLHMLTLIGGFAGALAAQSLLRHKTRKAAFVILPWLAAVLHLAVWSLGFALLR